MHIFLARDAFPTSCLMISSPKLFFIPKWAHAQQVLGPKKDQQSYAIYFLSKNLTSVEINYTVTEK